VNIILAELSNALRAADKARAAAALALKRGKVSLLEADVSELCRGNGRAGSTAHPLGHEFVLDHASVKRRDDQRFS
jgi:hypothetical protein